MDAFLYFLIYLTLQNFQQSISGRSSSTSTTMEYQNIPSSPPENATTELANRHLSSLPPIEPYVIHWNDDIQNTNHDLILYLNQITFPIESYQVTLPLYKIDHNERKIFYDINSLIGYKSNQDPELFEKISKTIQSIALCESSIYKDCYKYLFQLLLKYPTFKEKEIKHFQSLLENARIARKDLIFSYWFVSTFPNLPVEFFLKYIIEQLKEELFQYPTLKNFYEKNLEYLDLSITRTPCKSTLQRTDEKRIKYAFMFFFSNNLKPNHNTSLILTKTLQYLDPNDTNNKEEIMSLISRSCFGNHTFTGNVLSQNFYQEIELGNHKILIVYYKIPGTQTIVAFTEASYLKEHLEELSKKNVKKIYFGQLDLACITLKYPILPPIFQPLTENEIEQLNEIYGTFILVNPSKLEMPSNYYFNPDFRGIVCIASEDGKKVFTLKSLLKINKKMMEKIKEEI